MRRRDEAEREGRVAADVAIDARLEFRGGNFVADLEGLGGFAIAVARLHGEAIGLDDARILFEFFLKPVERRLHRAVVKPIAHSQGEEIFAAIAAHGVEAEFFQGDAGEARQLDGKKAVAVESMVFDGVCGHLRFAQVGFLEIVKVDDEDAVLFQVRQIHFERGGVHGDERVNGIAGRVDIVRRKMDLKAAHAGKSAGRGANFCGEIGQRGEVVAVKSDRVGELAAGDLHAVAGITAEANDRAINGFAFALVRRGGYGG